VFNSITAVGRSSVIRHPTAKMDDSELESLRSKRMAQMQSELGGVSETLKLY